jgi:putative lipoic acid-binding regulatory protein
MSISESNRFAPTQRAVQEQTVAYPAEFHFRIITEADVAVEATLGVMLAAYRVTAPLASSRASTAGRYHAYSVSVEIQSQAELHAFDGALKQVPGVRMVL